MRFRRPKGTTKKKHVAVCWKEAKQGGGRLKTEGKLHLDKGAKKKQEPTGGSKGAKREEGVNHIGENRGDPERDNATGSGPKKGKSPGKQET